MNSQPIRRWAASGVLAGALAFAGCGSGDDAATSATPAGAAAKAATPTATAAVSVPAGIRGSWTRHMKARDWKVAGNGYPLGTWRFDIAKDGTVSVYLPHTDTVDFSTQFAGAGEQLTVQGIPVCPGETGQYAWQAPGDKLTLNVVADGCKPRAALFGGMWQRRQ
jgi:hypothetical protein